MKPYRNFLSHGSTRTLISLRAGWSAGVPEHSACAAALESKAEVLAGQAGFGEAALQAARVH